MEKALLPEEMPPREVLNGRYRFRTPLRCDGVGRLDCVSDLHTGQRKVVRWLPLEVNRHGGQNIVHFCANLPTHSGLPEVCEVGEMEAWAYMVVDFPEGDLLAARKEWLKPEAWRKMASRLSGALSALHAAQVFHGEFCMPSVMLLGEEQHLLWDTQLVLCSRMADRRQADRILQQLVRTVSAMAPERVRGGPLTPEGDVYSLGAVLAYSAGGKQPAGPTLATVHAIATGSFQPEIPPALPAVCHNMLSRMLAPQAKDRPTMREVEAFFSTPFSTSLAAPPPSAPPLSVPPASLPPPSILPPGALPPAAPPANMSLSNTPPSGIPPRQTPVDFPAPKPSKKSPRRVAASPPPSSVTPTVSGTEWIQMLSPEETKKNSAPPPPAPKKPDEG